MIVRHFDINTPKVMAPGKEGWEQLSLGYYWMPKCRAANFRAALEELYMRIRESGNIAGGQFQQDCMLSILADIKKDKVNIFELGAGWGRVCLDVAAAIDFNIIQCAPKKYNCLAVEAEPVHYEWLKRHFEAQNISGIAVFGAVSNENGSCQFDSFSSSPDSEYGQAMSPLIGRRGFPNVRGLLKFLRGRTVRVPTYTLDFLMQKYRFKHVDIVQMDVQGAECDVILGAVDSINEGLIDYFLINIHLDEYGNMIHGLLSDKYTLVIDLKRGHLGSVEGFPPIHCHDGIQLYKRKGV